MDHESQHSEARERVLAAAERLFAERGYNAVTLRDISAEIGIRHTSLYHHVPEGKEALYMEVIERSFQRHRTGMWRAVKETWGDLRAQLYAAADWLLSHPPVDSIRLINADMPALSPANAERISDLAWEALLKPIESALIQAANHGQISQREDMLLIAGGLIGLIESMHAIPPGDVQGSRQQMAYALIDVVLDGLRPC